MAAVRIGVIGAGVIGRTHVETLQKEPEAVIAGVADPTPAAAYAEQRGLAYYADYAELLKAAKPDGVVIATPNPLHAPVGLVCAERGVHMLVEKPIAETIESRPPASSLRRRSGRAWRCWSAITAATTRSSRGLAR